MGYQYGLGIHRELTGRWSGGLGISYNQFENRSKFRNNETYDSANEAANTNGDLIYSSQFNFESPMEPLSIGIVFSPEGKNLQDGDLMQTEMGIMQKFHVWVADIQFSYLMINNGNWKFGLSAGTGLNFISDIGQVLDFELSRNGSLIDNRSFSSRVRQYSRFFPSYLAGLDLAYFHGPFDFGMSFSYGGSLGSIRPVDSVMKVKTNLTSVSGNFKVAWRFR
jgi:hypothetical protein